MTRPLSTMAETVKARLEKSYPIPLKLDEIAQMTGLDRTDAIDALYELEDRNLSEPVQWRAVPHLEVVE